MRQRLVEILVCPLDRQPLELISWEERQQALTPAQRERAQRLQIAPESLERVVQTGALINPRLKLYYPIFNGIPRMLVFTTSMHREFLRRFAEPVRRDLARYELPEFPSTPGERDVLRSFSAEWLNYEWDGGAYWNLQPQALIRAMRYMLDLEHFPLAGRRVLEVGIGIGGTANALATEDDCEVVGIDLGYAVDAAQRHFADNPFFQIAQCSVFFPAFREASFDYVYSHGVIHHTYSTKAAFDQLSRLPKPGGQLYVWVYSPFDERRNPIRRVLMALERFSRPIISRLPDRLQTLALLPFVPLYMGYQQLRKWKRGGDQVSYGVSEALHAARDRFAPRHIHRHPQEELVAWFRAGGYDAIAPLHHQTEGPDDVPPAFLTCSYAVGTRR